MANNKMTVNFRRLDYVVFYLFDCKQKAVLTEKFKVSKNIQDSVSRSFQHMNKRVKIN